MKHITKKGLKELIKYNESLKKHYWSIITSLNKIEIISHTTNEENLIRNSIIWDNTTKLIEQQRKLINDLNKELKNRDLNIYTRN